MGAYRNKEKNFISAVIYVHNVEEYVADFLRTVMEVLEEHFEHSEIICVNDHSEDNSAAVIRRVGKEWTTMQQPHSCLLYTSPSPRDM